MINRDASWPGNSSVHFIHNWRSAGTTISSILSSNFPNQYLKIGHPFTIFGWPAPYKNHPEPLVSLSQIRDKFTDSIFPSNILGGHTFLGLESLLVGPFDIWMNYRDPIQRLNSGLIRFYKNTKTINRSNNDLMCYDGPIGDQLLTSPVAVDHLLSTALSRESDGIAKRLAAFSISSNISLSDSSNVETPNFLSDILYDNSLLYEAARLNLERLAIVINSEHIHASLICIERFYNLSSPLINPFSDLQHNPKTISGSAFNDQSVIHNCLEVLKRHSAVDRKLFPLLNNKFAEQVNALHIDTKEIIARKALHSSPILLIKWFTMPEKFSAQQVASLATANLNRVCQQYPELSANILDLFLRWNVLSSDLRVMIARRAKDD